MDPRQGQMVREYGQPASSGGARAFGADISNKFGTNSGPNDCTTPPTAGSHSSVGARKGFKNNRKPKWRQKSKHRTKPFKDTNAIYPPNEAYEAAAREL